MGEGGQKYFLEGKSVTRNQSQAPFAPQKISSKADSLLSKILAFPLTLRVLFCMFSQGNEGLVNKDVSPRTPEPGTVDVQYERAFR